jgi:hypothetical protein
VSFFPSGYFSPTYFPSSYFGGAAATSYHYFEADLVAYLNTLGVKVYPGKIPQRATLPAIYFALVYGDSWTNLQGSAGVGVGHYQIGVSSTRYDDCGQLSARLEAALFKVRYQLGSTWVYEGILGNQLTQYAAPSTANDKGTHTKINEFTFTYQK